MTGQSMGQNDKPTLVITDHALRRCQQRGILPRTIDLLYRFGTSDWSDGAVTYRMDGRARRRMEKAVGSQLSVEAAEQADGCDIIVSADEPVLVTAARRLKRKRRS